MKVLKFGGGCLKDAESIKKIPKILAQFQKEKLIIVVSAFGKITNLLELHQYDEVSRFLFTLMTNLGFDSIEQERLMEMPIAPSWVHQNTQPSSFIKFLQSNNLSYPNRICMGEYISSIILHHYLNKILIDNIVIDAALAIKTKTWIKDVNYAEFDSIINPQKDNLFFYNSQNLSPNIVYDQMSQNIIITQGFIASENLNLIHSDFTKLKRTTLGREGSDYSAAIFSAMFNAEQVILYKDVDGVYNADPKMHPNAQFFKELSYEEAFSICNNKKPIVHPKTIKYLMGFSIPLLVKHFNNTQSPGTYIS